MASLLPWNSFLLSCRRPFFLSNLTITFVVLGPYLYIHHKFFVVFHSFYPQILSSVQEHRYTYLIPHNPLLLLTYKYRVLEVRWNCNRWLLQDDLLGNLLLRLRLKVKWVVLCPNQKSANTLILADLNSLWIQSQLELGYIVHPSLWMKLRWLSHISATKERSNKKRVYRCLP